MPNPAQPAEPAASGLTAPGAPGTRSALISLAGTPAAIVNGGMSLVTTLFAPITERSPTVTPLVITTFAPHQTLFPTRVGPLLENPCHGTGRIGSSKR